MGNELNYGVPLTMIINPGNQKGESQKGEGGVRRRERENNFIVQTEQIIFIMLTSKVHFC